jgi:hypothetical protein
MDSTKWLIIVRRGDTERFERLKTQFADNPDATVRFDRRVGPRRTRTEDRSSDRRRTERRNPEDPRLLIDGWFITPVQPRPAPEAETAD